MCSRQNLAASGICCAQRNVSPVGSMMHVIGRAKPRYVVTTLARDQPLGCASLHTSCIHRSSRMHASNPEQPRSALGGLDINSEDPTPDPHDPC